MGMGGCVCVWVVEVGGWVGVCGGVCVTGSGSAAWLSLGGWGPEARAPLPKAARLAGRGTAQPCRPRSHSGMPPSAASPAPPRRTACPCAAVTLPPLTDVLAPVYNADLVYEDYFIRWVCPVYKGGPTYHCCLVATGGWAACTRARLSPARY